DATSAVTRSGGRRMGPSPSASSFLTNAPAFSEGTVMTANEAAIRKAYQVAEDKDVAGWVNCFTEGGTFTDESIGVTYRGKELGRTVETYATAFPDMHRELYR